MSKGIKDRDFFEVQVIINNNNNVKKEPIS